MDSGSPSPKGGRAGVEPIGGGGGRGLPTVGSRLPTLLPSPQGLRGGRAAAGMAEQSGVEKLDATGTSAAQPWQGTPCLSSTSRGGGGRLCPSLLPGGQGVPGHGGAELPSVAPSFPVQPRSALPGPACWTVEAQGGEQQGEDPEPALGSLHLSPSLPTHKSGGVCAPHAPLGACTAARSWVWAPEGDMEIGKGTGHANLMGWGCSPQPNSSSPNQGKF